MFQSTHPSRGATSFAKMPISRFMFQSTHPSRGATCGSTPTAHRLEVSIRGSLYLGVGRYKFQSTRPVRGATPRHADLEHIVSFQSTRPVRGATRFNGPNQAFFLVSIHAPRAGRDIDTLFFYYHHSSFNPRAPCGARPRSFGRL